MVTCHDTVDLWRRYRETRSLAARNALVEYYMPLVHKRASVLIGRLPHSVSEDDLWSAGYEGLIQAVEAFDNERNVAFEGFCKKRLLGAMRDWLRQVSSHSRTVQTFLTRRNLVRNTLSTTYGRRAADEEVADEMGMQQSRFNYLSRIARNEEEIQLSVLERPNDLGFDGNSGEGSWEVADPRPIDPASKTARDLLLHAIASGLSRDERLMLTLYYCEELTMMEVGAVLDMSESRISQMHSALLKRLRVQLVCEHEYRRPGARPSLADKGRRARRPALVPAGAAA